MSTIDGESLLLPAACVGGVHVATTATALKAITPASSCYTFTATYTFTWKGAHQTYRKGQTYSLATDLKAALLAASAPMTAA